jgi:hypothetical protein
MERLADMQKQALEQKEAQRRAREGLTKGDAPGGSTGSAPPVRRQGDGGSAAGTQKRTARPTPKQGGIAPASSGGNGSGAKTNGAKANGSKANGSSGAAADDTGAKKTTHPRSKTKRERKDR